MPAESSRMAQQQQQQQQQQHEQQQIPPSGIPPPVTDGLSLPLPPVSLILNIGTERSGISLQRYLRKGDDSDATTAVVGKGGFGTAYRFIRDDSFTPPSSMTDTNNSGDTRQEREFEEENIEALRRISAFHESTTSEQMLTNPGSTKGLQEDLTRHYKNDLGKSFLQNPFSSPSRKQSLISTKAPAVIVIKVCRTPTSGSYDELPKAGKGKEEAKTAAYELAQGNPVGQHTRIVRGEARLLRYLQMAQSLKERNKREGSYLVRLFADTPMPDANGSPGVEQERGAPPVPRLLIFERLVELDAEMTSRGWVKNKRYWSVEKVEAVSRDVMAGLKFLHEHHVVHGDLKPSNFMRDPRSGCVKLIDLGASRRWVRLHNVAKERTTAVEELDQAVNEGIACFPKPGEVLCEGLGSLTGSPHFMAPEVLLQAGRYLSADGLGKNVLEDYMMNRGQLPNVPSSAYLDQAYRDFRRGWGIKADIWSWGCSALSLLLRTIPIEDRPSSSSICAFDFSFEDEDDALIPIWPLHESNDTLPKFHQWARLYPLRIMDVLIRGVELPDFVDSFSSPMIKILEATFEQQDKRASAETILKYMDNHLPSRAHMTSKASVGSNCSSSVTANSMDAYRKPSLALSSNSISGPSNPDDPHNIDLSGSTPLSACNSNTGLHASQQSFVMLEPSPQRRGGGSTAVTAPVPASTSAKGALLNAQQKFLQNRLVYSPLASPGLLTPAMPSPSMNFTQSMQRAAQELSPNMNSPSHLLPSSPNPQVIALPSPSYQPLGPTPMVRGTGSINNYHYSNQKSLSLADEVFMDAYEKEQKKMSPVSPFTPTVQIRQYDPMPPVTPTDNQQLHQQQHQRLANAENGKDNASSSSNWDREADQHNLRNKLSFPSLRLPKRTSFLSRVASHLTPKSPQQHYSSQQRSLSRNDWPSSDEMAIDEVSEDHRANNNNNNGGFSSLQNSSSLAVNSVYGHGATSTLQDDNRMESMVSMTHISPTIPSQSPMEGSFNSMTRARGASSSPVANRTSSSLHPRTPSSSSHLCNFTLQKQQTNSLRNGKSSSGVMGGGGGGGANGNGGSGSGSGILGLGLNINMPQLRSVRSFSSNSTREAKATTTTTAAHPPIHPFTKYSDACDPNARYSDGSSSTHQPLISPNDFLQHDPYAIDSHHTAQGSGGSSSNSIRNIMLNQAQQQSKRGRSWSTIFKRKKV